MSTAIKAWLFLGALVIGALYWLTRRGNAAAVGVAVSQAAGDLTAGAVQGAASFVGIPMTDEEKCAKAIKNRNSLDVSLYCPIGKFLEYEKDLMFGSDVAQIAGETNTLPDNGSILGVTNYAQ